MKRLICLFLLGAAIGHDNPANADTFGSGANTFDIEFVSIGNPGNDADTTGNPNPAGSVPYVYNIGKYEISRDMIIKANNVGNLAITLFDMTLYGGNGVNRPVTGVSWNEAARFVNWLNTSSGSPPAYKFAVQPGEVGYNANANIELWTSGDAGYNPNNLFRNSLARYFLPSVHEWYKAAYYDPASGDYYDFPTGSHSIPDGIDFADDPSFDAVFSQGGIAIAQPHDITNVGVLSPYGTAGQGGNIAEWQETHFDSLLSRSVRGGNWINGSLLLRRSHWTGVGLGPTFEAFSVGFRVASIPEPSTLLLLSLESLAVLWRRRG